MNTPVTQMIELTPPRSRWWLGATTWSIYVLFLATGVVMAVSGLPESPILLASDVGFMLFNATVVVVPIAVIVLLCTGRLGRWFAIPLAIMALSGSAVVGLFMLVSYGQNAFDRWTSGTAAKEALMGTLAATLVAGFIVGGLLARSASDFGSKARRAAWIGGAIGASLSAVLVLLTVVFPIADADGRFAVRVVIAILCPLVACSVATLRAIEFPLAKAFAVIQR